MDFMSMTFSDVLFWYDRYELQSTEEEVIHQLSYDDKGNKKTLPSPQRIRDIVLSKIKERKEKYYGS